MSAQDHLGHQFSDEDRISVAEQVMERAGLAGRTLHVPAMHQDDPARVAAHQPVHDYVHGVLRDAGHPQDALGSVRVIPKHWDLRNGGGQAVTTATGSIGLAGEHASEMTLLHEAAHILHRSAGHYGGHGPEFQDTLHGLYRKHLGDQAADTFMGILRPRA